MECPHLKIDDRDIEFRRYPEDVRKEVVLNYLFSGTSMRSLDIEVLGIEDGRYNGFISMGILHHYGLTPDHQKFFRNMTPEEALEHIPDTLEFAWLSDMISGSDENFDPESHPWVKGYTQKRLVNTRVNQDRFRKAVLDAYGGKCCITGISGPELLRASHIKPWCESDELEKTDVCNGLCLNALHDAAFDTGLITVDPSGYGIRLSPRIEDSMPRDTYDSYFRKYDGMRISLPDEDSLPRTKYLEYHRDHIFGRKQAYRKMEIEIPSESE